MTKRPIEWTDEELARAAHEHVTSPNVTVYRHFLATLGAVHPAEVREREREACLACFRELPLNQTTWMDKRYPSLLPPSPPPLVLSTGTWRRKACLSHGNRLLWDDGGRLLATAPVIATASDALALADWLSKYGSDDERK